LQTLSGHAGMVRAIAFSPDGANVAYGDDWSSAVIRLCRVNDGATLWSQSLYPFAVSDIAFSPDGSMLAVGIYSKITLRNQTDGEVTTTITNLTDTTMALAFLSSTQLVSLTGDSAVKFWQTNGTLLRSFNVNTEPSCGAFSFDGATLAVGYTNGQIHLVRLADGVVQKIFAGHSNQVLKVGLSADGAMLFSAATNEFLLWRIEDGVVLRRYTEEILSPSSLAVSPRGDSFAFGRMDATFLIAKKPDFLLPFTRGESGSAFLRFSGASGFNYIVETSTELQTWFPWTNIVCSNQTVSVSVPISSSTNLFYRLNR
jgi:WD40 repeat protein